jgi:hypothetical protein
MPVHLEEQDGKHCVVEPSGKVVPSGCYDSRDDALARLRAINANKEDGEFTSGLAHTVTHPIDIDALTVDGAITVFSDSTTWLPLGSEKAMEDEIEIKEKDGEQEDEKGLGLMIDLGPTTFAELDNVREARKEDGVIKTIVSDFMALVGNIMNFPSENGKAADLRQLVKEMEERLPLEDEEDEDKPRKEKDSNTGMEDERMLFTIWKDESTGVYRWLGIYSNKFRDDDSPAEILAEDAHLRFIEQVEKGELAYPDLYVWHISVPVGKADLLAYDDAGFSIASGVIEEDFAIALMNTSEDLAMSHGMPAKSIRRDDPDKTVITGYVSTEVSVLPRWAAANKLTDFYIQDEEEAKMAIFPEEKRQQITNLLGTELTEQLEAGLAARGEKAIAENVEFKEEDVAAEDTAEEEAETTAEKTEIAVEEEEEAAEEQVAETEDMAEESVDESEAGAAEEEAATEEPTLQKDDVVEALAFVVETMTAQNKQLTEAIEGIGERVATLEGGVGSLQKSTEEQIAELAAGTPEASMTALLTSKLAAAGSVIGNPATRVHGNSALAKEGPEETPEEEVTEGEAGLFFKDW